MVQRLHNVGQQLSRNDPCCRRRRCRVPGSYRTMMYSLEDTVREIWLSTLHVRACCVICFLQYYNELKVVTVICLRKVSFFSARVAAFLAPTTKRYCEVTDYFPFDLIWRVHTPHPLDAYGEKLFYFTRRGRDFRMHIECRKDYRREKRFAVPSQVH